MAERLASSADLFARALAASPGGVHSPVRAFRHVGGAPIFVESAAGSAIVSADGQQYTDYCMSFGPLILGHRHPAVAEELHAAIDAGWTYGAAERYSLELIELIKSQISWVDHIRFVNSGTEAVMTALRLARAATGREGVLKFSGCYHGHVDTMLVEAGSGMATQASSAGVGSNALSSTLVTELDSDAQLEAVFSESGHDLAAAIIEPLPANYGLLPQRQEFLRRLRQLCTQHGVLLIFDEVISGFRIGFGGCTEACGIEPDLVTWGKIIGGGFPVGAVAGKTEILSRLAPLGDVYQAGTLSANPVAMRAGLATLRQLIDGTVYAQLETLGQALEAQLELRALELQRNGSLFWLYPGTNAEPPRTAAQVNALDFPFDRIFSALIARGIYLPPSPYEVGFLSAAHTDADVEALASALNDIDGELSA